MTKYAYIDRKRHLFNLMESRIDHWFSEIRYYPFGMVTPGRSFTAGSGYRFGFNGKESDAETYGSGNIYDYGFRIYNPRLGKFLSVDPLSNSFPWYSPYHYAGNSPIRNIDLDGLEEYSRVEYSYQGVVFLTITTRLEKENRARVGDNDDNPTIDQGVYVKKIELTPAQFQAFTTATAENPANYKANIDFSAKDVIADPLTVLSESEKVTLDGNKDFRTGGGHTKIEVYPPQKINLNFATNDASISEVVDAYNTDKDFATKIDITVRLLINFPAANLTIQGFTDADPTSYTSTNPDNPFFGTPGNEALSWDRANTLSQFVAQRASATTGQPATTYSSRIKAEGRGVSRGATISDSEDTKATQRRFVMKLTGE